MVNSDRRKYGEPPWWNLHPDGEERRVFDSPADALQFITEAWEHGLYFRVTPEDFEPFELTDNEQLRVVVHVAGPGSMV